MRGTVYRLPGEEQLAGIQSLPNLELLDVVGGPWLNNLQSPNWVALSKLPKLACLNLQNPMRLSNQSLASLNMKALPDRLRLALRYGLDYRAGVPIRADIFSMVDDGLPMIIPSLQGS